AGSLMLRRRGIPSRLVLGVRREPDGLAAHAWLLTAAGAIVCGGPEAEGFVPIAAFHAGRR
ncbi:MAG: lasso peptide biosynthesis B2 protein, partial [Alphaproteobacteria bacterium]|nr:lasso peptide biosynthesis B2 protein [Alphaproteobacteria bacterium]